MMRFVIFLFCLFYSFPAGAVVLDWTGSYQVEFNVLQKTDFEKWGPGELFHNLHLKPDIKAFDGVRVRSWFYLAGREEPSLTPAKFYPQEGISFGLRNKDFPPGIFVRDLYLEVAHDFGFFQTGWKPHHFGLGLYYNDGSAPFSPAYNAQGSTGFLSWRGFIGSSYYVQPMAHYIGDALFNLFIQAGYSKEQYGIELMYKTYPQGAVDNLEPPIESPSYLGIYGYYNTDTLSAQLEGGRTADELYGMALAINWQSPVSWLDLTLDLALSTSDNNRAFYFDPSFSASLSFLIENYEERANSQNSDESQGKEGAYSGYSFNSAFHVSPSLVFSLSDSVELEALFSVQLSYSDWEVLLYHAELVLQYQLMEGLIWKNSLGALSPKEENPYIGFISQAAITF